MKAAEQRNSKNICGERIREARKNRVPALTQKDLAARLEIDGAMIDRMAINRIEAGNRCVSDYELVAISKVLGVTIEWLLFGD